MPAGPNTRGVSGVTLTQFFTAVLRGLGAPVTANNLAKLGAIAATEGHGGSYNPFNYVVPANGSTNFNNINHTGTGVQNYPDVQTGIAQTIKLLSGNRGSIKTARANLMSDGAYSGFTGAFSQFYNSWGGGSIKVSQQTASQKLNGILDGPPVPQATRTAIAQGQSVAAGNFNYTPTEVKPVAPVINAGPERQEFDAYLRSLPPDQATQIVHNLQTGAPAGDSPQIQRYSQFLGSLDQAGRNAETNMLAAPDPKGSAEMTNLLQTLGVSYPNAPNPTPALLTFLKGIGLNMSTAEDVRRRAVERIGASTSDAMADIDRTAGRTKQNITADLVRRNILSSGESNTRYARQAEDVSVAQGKVQQAAAQGNEDVATSYKQSIDTAKQQALDRIIGAEQDQSTSKAVAAAQEDSYRRQQAAGEASNAAALAAQERSTQAQIAALSNGASL